MATDRRIPMDQLVDTATTFSLGVMEPMMRQVRASDFGAGRNLRISEKYARNLIHARWDSTEKLMEQKSRELAARTAYELVYGYPHHLFPIDINEAVHRLHLNVERMDDELYEESLQVLRECKQKNFIGFISEPEAQSVKRNFPELTSQSAHSGKDLEEGLMADVGILS